MKNSLKKNQDFKKVYCKGKSLANRYLVMYVLPNNMEDANSRLGISVSKKVGNSVVRHRITRLIRESYRLHCDEIKTGYDIVVIGRVSAKEKGYKEIESAFLHLIGMHKLDI